ncbi:MAG: DsrE family protein [Saprospiraceae bacterium]|nr:DsrE family protein [Saprospiraceae bacterium]
MLKKIRVIQLMIFLFCCSFLQAQRSAGPIIAPFGAVHKVEDPDFKVDTSQSYKVVFDIAKSPDQPGQINPQLNTLARFLNMHAQAGVPAKNLKVACAIHNLASKDALSNEAYQKRYGMDNPNLPLLKALEEAGAEIYICGQSIHSRKIDRSELAGPVKVALSAMTVLITKQNEGYRLIAF